MPIRMNKNRREILNNFADRSVACPDEDKIANDAYDKAADLVRSAVQERFPPEDMALLEKYQVASKDRCIQGGTPAGSHAAFYFKDDDDRAPLAPKRYCSTRSIPFDKKTANAIFEATKMKNRYHDALTEKRRHYMLLINSAKTFEEIVDIWPAAETMRKEVEATMTALSTISEEMAAKIRADNAGAKAA